MDSLRKRVFNLIPELSDLKSDLQRMLELLLEDLEAYREIFTVAGGIAENLVNKVLESSPLKKKPTNLMDKIEFLRNEGILPSEVASYLHTIRVFANKARHRVEKITFKRIDAENILGILLRVIEWFYCEWDRGPRYASIYREIPEFSGLVSKTISTSGTMYLLFTPAFAFVLQKLSVENEVALLAFVIMLSLFTFFDQFKKTRKFLGLRKTEEAYARYRSYAGLFFASLLVILNTPLLSTAYTGVDPYGFFLLINKHSKIWAIALSLLVNFILSSIATALFLWISLEWAKRKPQDIVSSTFTSVLFPILFVYFLVVFTQHMGMEAYFLVAFFPMALAFLGIVGYSHPENHLDLFTAKIVFILGIAFMVFGFVLAMGGMLYKLYELSHYQWNNIFTTHLWSKTFSWSKLGFGPDVYREKVKLGFTWTVLFASFYLELGVGAPFLISFYHYQLRPAIDRILLKE